MPYVCLHHVINLCFYKSVYCKQPSSFVRSICHSHRKCFSALPQSFENHADCWKVGRFLETTSVVEKIVVGRFLENTSVVEKIVVGRFLENTSAVEKSVVGRFLENTSVVEKSVVGRFLETTLAVEKSVVGRFLETTLVVEKIVVGRFLENTLVVEKIVVGPYLKSWGLGECYKLRKPIVFCWRFGKTRLRYIWKHSSSSNDFQEWLRLTT